MKGTRTNELIPHDDDEGKSSSNSSTYSNENEEEDSFIQYQVMIEEVRFNFIFQIIHPYHNNIVGKTKISLTLPFKVVV